MNFALIKMIAFKTAIDKSQKRIKQPILLKRETIHIKIIHTCTADT